MAQYILRVEGVDFDNTVFDTQNLSIVRGSSLALLNAPRAVEKFLNKEYQAHKPTKIFTGASQGAFKIEAESHEKAEELAKAVLKFLNRTPETPDSKDKSPDIMGVENKARRAFSHLSFVVDMVAGDDIEALKCAHTKNRLSQMQAPRWPLPVFDENAKGYAANYDRIRPATEPWNDKKAQKTRTLRSAQDDKDHHDNQDRVSKSGFDRFKYGRDGRENFYADFIAGDNQEQQKQLRTDFKKQFTFCNDFEGIVADKPDDLTPSLQNKIAVFYADGNKFSKIFRDQKSVDNYKFLSESILEKQQALLQSILGWFFENSEKLEPKSMFKHFALEHDVLKDKQKTGVIIPAFRFETLLWGGEELLFVMPAWLGLAFAQGFFDCVKDWKVPEGIQHEGEPLTFSAGLIFCHHKTPIRQAKKVAQDLAEAGKDVLGDNISAQKNVINIEMFESIAMPDADVSGYRQKLYSITDESGDEDTSEKISQTLKSLLTLDMDVLNKALNLIDKMKDQFPRSQVYKFIRSAKKPKERNIFDVGDIIPTSEQLREFGAEVDRYFERAGAGFEGDRTSLNFLADSHFVKKRSEHDKIEPLQSLAYSCTFIAQFWDYVNPTGQPVPALSPDCANSITTTGGV